MEHKLLKYRPFQAQKKQKYKKLKKITQCHVVELHNRNKLTELKKTRMKTYDFIIRNDLKISGCNSYFTYTTILECTMNNKQ